jgi:exodeoxyribonuclease VII small subunit
LDTPNGWCAHETNKGLKYPELSLFKQTKTMAKQSINYSDAVAELEQILIDLETSKEIDMDKISSKVKRATELMKICKDQLHILDKDIEKILQQLEE